LEKNKMSTTTNIFENAVILATETHAWGNTKKIPTETIQKIADEGLSEWIRMNKGLIDRTAMEEIYRTVNKFRNTCKSFSLPFPGEGVYLVPISNIEKLTEKLENVIDDFQSAVNTLESNFEEYINSAETELGDNFNREDYPKNIKRKFGMSYRFLSMAVPGQLQKVSAQVFKEEEAKFKNMMEETRKECILYLREGFLEAVTKITTILKEKDQGEAKKLHTRTLDKIETLYNEFQTKNLFKDDALQQIMKDARGILFGIDNKDLSESPALRKAIIKQMEEVQDVLASGVETIRRKISFRKE
jgi:hypothetical protein